MAEKKGQVNDEGKSSQFNFDIKTVAVVVVVLIAVLLTYLVLKPGSGAGSTDFMMSGQAVDSRIFLNSLSSAQSVFIVQDLRGADLSSRQNIQQCGVDFASTLSLIGKNLTSVAIENEQCATSFGTKTIAECVQESEGSDIIIHIKQGQNTTFYEHGIVVGLQDLYDPPCGVYTRQN